MCDVGGHTLRRPILPCLCLCHYRRASFCNPVRSSSSLMEKSVIICGTHGTRIGHSYQGQRLSLALQSPLNTRSRMLVGTCNFGPVRECTVPQISKEPTKYLQNKYKSAHNRGK